MNKITHEDFLIKLEKRNEYYRKGLMKVLGDYKGADTLILIETKYGLVHSTPSNLYANKFPTVKSAVNRNSYIINKFIEIHGFLFDYTGVDYKNSKTKVKISCKIHGAFWQTPDSHLVGNGCLKCSEFNTAKDKKERHKNVFKEIASKKHNNFYDYSKSAYVDSYSKVIITCPIHGDFEQAPNRHLQGRGCSVCGLNRRIKSRTKDEEAILTSLEKANFNVIYCLPQEYNLSTEIKAKCMVHGVFYKTLARHCVTGCNKCSWESTGDKNRRIPKKLNIIVNRFRSRIKRVLKSKNKEKEASSFEFLGCNYYQFKKHLNNNLYGFNVGVVGLDLDHIVPISKIKEVNDLYFLVNYKNFQLLPSYYNRFIKKDKKWDKDNFEMWLKVYELIHGKKDYGKKLTIKNMLKYIEDNNIQSTC